MKTEARTIYWEYWKTLGLSQVHLRQIVDQNLIGLSPTHLLASFFNSCPFLCPQLFPFLSNPLP